MSPHPVTLSQPERPAPSASTNTLLGLMPPESRRSLLTQGTRIALKKNDTLSEAGAISGSIYFPCSGLVSLQTMTEAGDSIEIAMVGSDGLIGNVVSPANSTAPYSAVVSIAGEAIRVRRESLVADFERSGPARRVLLDYSYRFLAELAQGSACHRFHTARQRLARWLLVAADRTGSTRIEMTQEELAHRLGLQRTRVTTANLGLQDLGAIRARHGRITIADRRRLALAACACYNSHDGG